MKVKTDLNNKGILIMGAAGFMGASLCMRLLRDCPTAHIVGIDNMNDYYEVSLKEYRLAEIEKLGGNFTFVKGSVLSPSCLLFQRA